MGILQKWVNRVTHFLPPGRQQQELSSLLCCCYQSNSQALLMPGSPQLAEWALTAVKPHDSAQLSPPWRQQTRTVCSISAAGVRVAIERIVQIAHGEPDPGPGAATLAGAVARTRPGSSNA